MQIEIPCVGGPADGKKIIYQTPVIIVGSSTGAQFYVAETKGPLQIPFRYLYQPDVYVAFTSDFR